MISDKRLTIIPDGQLSYLPFEALLTRMPDTTSIHFYDLQYLILDHPVTYSYSSRLLYHKSSKPGLFDARALAFSPAYPAYNRINNDSVFLPAIPGIYDEVEFLDKQLRTHTFSGEKATEENFREECGNYDILHLAMHTLINDSLPMLSRLAFFQENRDSLNNDGWLTTADIYYLHLRAKMVVLSACKSGSGSLKSGEGIISLARGFFYAGCPSVLMSLWDVEDMSTTRIMKGYYRNLRLGKTKDRALQEAKVQYLREADPLTSHPHLWMGMITIGNPEPLFRGKEKYFLILIGAILLYLAIDLIRKNPAGKNRLDHND
jgi:CHAT domain-containing protein